MVRSWLGSANLPGCTFPIQNLPFGVFRRSGTLEPFRGGVAIGDQIIDLAALAKAQLFAADAADGIRAGALPGLNALMELGPQVWTALRRALFAALARGSARETVLQSCLVPQSAATYSLPAQIGDYTDFYISIYHA